MTLSFDEIRRHVANAIANACPPVARDGEDPYPGASRYYISRIWSDMVLVSKGYWALESDVSRGFIKYSLKEEDEEVEVSLESLVGAKLQAVSEDGTISITLESDSADEDDYLSEAGKRNSKKDKATLNAILRTLVNLLNSDEIDDETLAAFNKKIAAPSPAKTKKDSENSAATTEAEPLTEARLDLIGVLRKAEEKAFSESVEGQIFTEQLEAVVTGVFDKKNLIVKDHKVLGIISKNGYTYPIATQQEALPIFEGAKAYLNHPTTKEMGEARNVRDLIGYHKNLRVKEDGTYSDLHLINNRTVQDYVIPVAETASHLIGSSVVIRGKMKNVKDSLPQIEKIYACRSIDLVSEPATTNGLYESDQHTGHSNNNTQSEDTMELKDLTLDALKKERADLVEQILASVEEGKKVTNLETQVSDLQAKLKEGDEKIARLELDIANRDAAETKKQAELEIEAMVRDSKIPDSVKYEEKDGKKVTKSHFYNILKRCESSDERRAIISDWEESCKGIPTEEKKSTSKPVSPEQKFGNGTVTESAVEQLYHGFSH